MTPLRKSLEKQPQPAIDPFRPVPEPAIDPVTVRPEPAIDPVPGAPPPAIDPYPGDVLTEPQPAIDPFPGGYVKPTGSKGAYDGVVTDSHAVSGHERHLALALKPALAAEKVPDIDLTHVSDLSKAKGFHLTENGRYVTSAGQALLAVRLSAPAAHPGAAGSGASTVALVDPRHNTWRLLKTRGLDPAADYSPSFPLPAGIHFNGPMHADKVALLEDIANGR